MSKGAYKYEGGKRMPATKSGLTGTGRMSSAHALVQNKSPTKGMRHAEGRLGADCPGFRSGIPSEPGYKGGSTAHGKQPKGHKSDA